MSCKVCEATMFVGECPHNAKTQAELINQFCKRAELPGFKSEFNKRYLLEAGNHPRGTADVEVLGKEILKDLGLDDPYLNPQPKRSE